MWFFGKKDKSKDPVQAAKDDAKARALAQMSATRSELGDETIEKMASALNMEKARGAIRAAIDGQSKVATRDDVREQLRDMIRDRD